MSRQAQWSWWKFWSTGSIRSSWGSWTKKKLWSFLSLSLSLWRGSSGGERWLRESLFLSATPLKGGGSLVGVGLFSHLASDRIRNSLRLCQGMLRLNISKHSPPKELSGTGTGCLGRQLYHYCCRSLKAVFVLHKGTGWSGGLGNGMFTVRLNGLKSLFQPKSSIIIWIYTIKQNPAPLIQ